MTALEQVLLPREGQSQRQKVQVLHGLGGIGKTQLAVEFARRHHRQFSSVLWLDGRSENSLKRSIASQASRTPEGQITETSRAYAADGSADVDAVVKDVMDWLARPDNTAWLLIFDNVDREYSTRGRDTDAYDVSRYLSGADHGSVLITTRLARLEQLGDSQQLGKVDQEQARTILESWYKKKSDTAESKRLLELLDGLPLAIAQAGAYLQESGVGLKAYLGFYEQQWDELMNSGDEADTPLQDYPNRSVWTTWTISYQAIRNKHDATANLLLLWSFLDNKDLWHGLLATRRTESAEAKKMLSEWIGDIASSKLAFSQAMQLLRNYSLIEAVEGTESYATHPVMHQWAYHYQGKQHMSELMQLAVITVGWAVPEKFTRDYSSLQQRLLPHAQACSRWLIQDGKEQGDRSVEVSKTCITWGKKPMVLLEAMHMLGCLYAVQGKLAEAEQMCEWSLQGIEEALGPNHASIPGTVNNLGLLYAKQGKRAEAEQMYKRALQGREEALGPNHTSTLHIVNNLGLLYADQGKHAEAEQMYKRALQGKEEALGPNHTSTLNTVNNLGVLYAGQGKLVEAEQMYEQALQGYRNALGSTLVQTYRPALNTLENMGNLYAKQKDYARAQTAYKNALSGLQLVLGPSHSECCQLSAKMEALGLPTKRVESVSELALGPSIPGASVKDDKQHREDKKDKKKKNRGLRVAIRRFVDKIV